MQQTVNLCQVGSTPTLRTKRISCIKYYAKNTGFYYSDEILLALYQEMKSLRVKRAHCEAVEEEDTACVSLRKIHSMTLQALLNTCYYILNTDLCLLED